MVDDQQPRAEPLDVGQVVRGQQHGDAALAVDARRGSRGCAPWRRRRGRSSARRGRGSRGRAAAPRVRSPRMRWPSESWRTGVSRNGSSSSSSRNASRFAPVAVGRHAVDVAQQLERVEQRQVPPELRALPEDDADPPRQLRSAARAGLEPGDRDAPAGRHEDAGQHLDRRRLAGPVRADVADHLARARRETRRRRRRATSTALPPEPRPRLAPDARTSCRRRSSSIDRASLSPRCSGSGARRRATPARATSAERPRPAARRTASHGGQPERIVPVEHVERREVATKASGTTKMKRRRSQRAVDVERVLREEAAAVGEDVRHLAAVDVQNATPRRVTQSAAKITAPRDDRRRAHRDRPAVQSTSSATSARRARPRPAAPRPSRRSAKSRRRSGRAAERPDQDQVERARRGSAREAGRGGRSTRSVSAKENAEP